MTIDLEVEVLSEVDRNDRSEPQGADREGSAESSGERDLWGRVDSVVTRILANASSGLSSSTGQRRLVRRYIRNDLTHSLTVTVEARQAGTGNLIDWDGTGRARTNVETLAASSLTNWSRHGRPIQRSTGYLRVWSARR